MRIRASTGVLLAAAIASVAGAALIQAGAGGAIGAIRWLCLVVGMISGVWLVARGLRIVRDWIIGRGAHNREMFPRGRCHACGYDTSTLVRGIVACPECGAVLASIPACDRVPGDAGPDGNGGTGGSGGAA